MIINFRHKGLELLYEKGDRRRVQAAYAAKIERMLARLDIAESPNDMALPGYRLHPLQGDLFGHWAISVSANWRITFRFEDKHVRDVDLIDYH